MRPSEHLKEWLYGSAAYRNSRPSDGGGQFLLLTDVFSATEMAELDAVLCRHHAARESELKRLGAPKGYRALAK